MNANNYGICKECYIVIAQSKWGYSDLKKIDPEFFNAAPESMLYMKMIAP